MDYCFIFKYIVVELLEASGETAKDLQRKQIEPPNVWFYQFHSDVLWNEVIFFVYFLCIICDKACT